MKLKKLARLPDAELEIMKAVWNGSGPEGEVTSAEICKQLEGKKDWAVTTVLNFLARLVEKEFLSVKRSGKTNLYSPLVKEDDYLKKESKSFLERLHGNSLKSFVAALYDGDAITPEDLMELRSFIDKTAEAEKGEMA